MTVDDYVTPRNVTVDMTGGIAMPPMQPAGAPSTPLPSPYTCIQAYLAHEQAHPQRILQQAYNYSPTLVPGHQVGDGRLARYPPSDLHILASASAGLPDYA